MISIKQDSDIADSLHKDEKFPSDFYNALKVPEFIEIEKILKENCVNNTTIYSNCIKETINGFKVCRFPKNKLIYKAMAGFISDKREKAFLTKNINNVFYFSNKYYVYSLAKDNFTGINVYKLKKDLIFLDYFEPSNLEIILNYAKKNKLDDLYNNTIAYTGYKISKENQSNKLKKKHPSWTDIWEFENPLLYPFTAIECAYSKIDDVNPTTIFNGVLHTDKKYLPDLISNLLMPNGIDGILRKQVKGTFQTYGVTPEELIITGSAILSLKIDKTDPLYWENWNHSSIHKDFVMSSFLNGANKNFKIMDFYFNNINNKFYKIKSEFSIVSFNVHNFNSINGDINIVDNVINFIKMIKTLNSTVLILQEFSDNNKFLIEMNAIYPFHTKCINGSSANARYISYIFIFSKIPINNITIIDLSVKVKRDVILCNVNGYNICAVHLDIGKRFHRLGDGLIKDNIIKKNTELRIGQINKILKYKPDIIIGDFNFSIEDAEYKYISKTYKNVINVKTNPYNTTDMVFYKTKKIESMFKTDVIKCNYSDHLPICISLKK